MSHNYGCKIMDLSNYVVNDKINKGVKRIKHNDTVADTYARMAKKFDEERYVYRSKTMRFCFKYWDTEYYRIQAVKDIKRVNLCRDLFCPNCQHNLSQVRERKYFPVINQLKNGYGVYHVTFTVPNCSGSALRSTINKMFSKFVYVNQYLQGKRKIKDVDLLKYGYVGNVRALEVSINRQNGKDEYHPHFHCIFVMKKNLRLKKYVINRFSFDATARRKSLTKFSDFEVFLQKFWYCLINDVSCTKNNVESSEGYSVLAEPCTANSIHQVFKYAVGGLFKKENFYVLSSEDDLRNLDVALRNRKMIQGYGVFRKVAFEDDTAQRNEIYEQIQNELKRFEDPIFAVHTLKEIQEDFKNHPEIKYISKNSLRAEKNNE